MPWGLRRWWLVGAGLLGVGMLVAAVGVGPVAVLPGLLVVAAAAGRTAALGSAAPRRWLAAAWSVPALPTLATLAPLVVVLVLPWRGDPLLVFLVVWALVTVTLLVWGTFLIAAVVEVLLRRANGRTPAGAWKNDPARPPSS